MESLGCASRMKDKKYDPNYGRLLSLFYFSSYSSEWVLKVIRPNLVIEDDEGFSFLYQYPHSLCMQWRGLGSLQDPVVAQLEL